jgi:hypothetical protein
LTIPDAVRRLAEEANAYVPLGEGSERIEDPRYVVFLMRGLATHPEGTTVLRLRLGEGDVGAAVGTATRSSPGSTVSRWRRAP